ncbi:hypothetical protein BLM14_24885 (plasmid) [Phyllobacterium zundukense]|nr:hypothetical protein BLM14_24885 [Phyllobacterium zundukense]
MALPLSLGGALLPLVLTGTSFSMPVVIGLLMLMGVVTKNSILLVEYAIMSRRAGFSRFDALIDACHKHARPIVMTTIAMACGMLPVALSISGGDPSFRQPMAIVVIGGLMTSTVLSLVVIPVVFIFVDDLLEVLKRLGNGTRWGDLPPNLRRHRICQIVGDLTTCEHGNRNERYDDRRRSGKGSFPNSWSLDDRASASLQEVIASVVSALHG